MDEKILEIIFSYACDLFDWVDPIHCRTMPNRACTLVSLRNVSQMTRKIISALTLKISYGTEKPITKWSYRQPTDLFQTMYLQESDGEHPMMLSQSDIKGFHDLAQMVVKVASSSSTGGTGGSTGGLEPFSSFTCTELTPVELQLKEAISGSFTADGVPIDLLAVMVKGGATDFQVDIAGPVAPDDPYAADVAFWEQDLTAIGWDVNPPGPPADDRRYIFIPEGAQFVAKFALFYYRIYEGGGNGQFEFECLKQ